MTQFTISITTDYDIRLNKTRYTAEIFKTEAGTIRYSNGLLCFQTKDDQIIMFTTYSMQELLEKINNVVEKK